MGRFNSEIIWYMLKPNNHLAHYHNCPLLVLLGNHYGGSHCNCCSVINEAVLLSYICADVILGVISELGL